MRVAGRGQSTAELHAGPNSDRDEQVGDALAGDPLKRLRAAMEFEHVPHFTTVRPTLLFHPHRTYLVTLF